MLVLALPLPHPCVTPPPDLPRVPNGPKNPMTPQHHPDHHKKHRTPLERLRTLFLAGLLVIVPVVVAVYSVMLLMGLTEQFFGHLIDAYLAPLVADPAKEPTWVPIVRAVTSFIMAIGLILFIGWLSTFLLIRRAIGFGEALIARVPLVKFFYNVPKEVLNTFAMQQKASYKRVVLIEYPRKDIWAVAFATGELKLSPSGHQLVAVFAPTTPNPTSGFLLYLPPDQVYDTNLPIEEGARLIISGGILSPDLIHCQPFCGLDREPVLPPNIALFHSSDPLDGAGKQD